MKVYLLISESEWGCCCPVDVDEVLGAFGSAEAAMNAGPEVRKKYGWRQGKHGDWYYGRTDTKGHNWERTHRIDELEVQG